MGIRIALILSLAITAGLAYFAFDQRAAFASEPSELVLSIDNSPIERDNGERVLSYADMLEKVTPAVVSITTSNVVRVPSRPGMNSPLEDFLRRYYGMPDGGGGERQREVRGMGSGLVVSADGYIATNHHVIASRNGDLVDEIMVKLPDGREFEAEIIGSDPDTDVAVLKVETGDELPYLTISDSDNLRVGDIVFAVGNPLGVGLTVTQGIVSGVGRTDLGILGLSGYENFIQTDASINVGNSGGPLIDVHGRVVGINTAILSRTGGNIGIGFAIPVNLAQRVMEGIVTGEGVRRGFLGIRISDLNGDLARSFGLDSTKGALVGEVNPDSPAEEAGIRHGDIILEVNDEVVDSASDLRFLISRIDPGEQVDLTVRRGERTLNLEVTLGDRAVLLGEDSGAIVNDRYVLEGVSLSVLNDAQRERFEIDAEVEGVVVTDVAADSPFSRLLRPGIVILEVNGKEVRSLKDFRENLERPGYNNLYVLFNGQRSFLALRLRE
jgi:serine protease Do/serine protease DegQ